MAVVTSGLVNALRTGFSKEFEDAKAAAPTQWAAVATRVPSGNASNTYGWLGQFPKLSEWTGQRAFKSIREFGYSFLLPAGEVFRFADKEPYLLQGVYGIRHKKKHHLAFTCAFLFKLSGQPITQQGVAEDGTQQGKLFQAGPIRIILLEVPLDVASSDIEAIRNLLGGETACFLGHAYRFLRCHVLEVHHVAFPLYS